MASYINNAKADAYFATRYPKDEWDAATADEKTATLATATRLIDQLNFAGEKTDSNQENEFPRNTLLTIPVAIENACCEIAYALLEGHNVEYDAENVNIIKSKFGDVATEKDKDAPLMHLIHNIPSSQAWNYLRPYLLNTQTLKIERTS